ncbi:MAG: hypothetical protein ACK451_05680, partial [Pseudanabaena sp.]
SKGELVSLSQVQIDSNWKITDINNQSLKMKGKGFVTLPNIAAIAVPPNPEQLKKAIKTLNADKDSSKGSLDFDIDWDLTRGQGTIDLQSPNLQIAAVQGFAVSLPFEIQEGLLDFEAKVAILAGKEAPNISVTAQLTEGSIKSPKLPKPITQIAGKLNYDGTTASLKEFVAEYDFLKATVEGTFDQQKGFNVNFASTSLDLAKAIESFKVKVPVMIAGEIKLSGKLTGTSQKPALTMEISTPKPVSFDRIKVDRFLTTVELKDLNTLLIKKFQAASTGATLTGIGQIKLPQKDKPAEILFNSSLVGVAEEFINLYDTKLPVTIGQVTSSLQITGNLNNPQVLAQIEAPNATYPARGEVFIEDGLATIRNTKVSFPIGEVGLAGTYNIASGAWKTQLNSNGIPLAAFLPNQKGILQGLLNLRSDRGSFVLTDIIGDASIQLPQGLTELPDAITANLIWDGKNLLIPSLQVSNYLTANGNVDLAFPNNSPNQLPTGIAGINLDMISRNVSISRLASLSSVIPPQASGMLNFRGNLSGAIDKLKISGALQLEDVNLASLGSGLAKQGLVAPSRGSLNFNGSINGYFPDPRLVGNLRIAGLKVNQIELDNLNFQGVLDGISKVPQATGDLLLAGLRVDKLAFDPRLEGKVNFNANQGANIDLRGNRDRIVANLDQSFRPIDFNVNLGEATARGRRLDNNPNRLQVVVNNLPLPLVASFTGQNDLSGKVSSNLIADFSNNPKANGEVIIERPRFGRFIAERAIAKVTYADGVFSLRDGNLTVRQGESTNEYKFNLTYSPALDDSLAGAVEIAQGRMQDVFATLQWANIVDTTQVFSLTKTRAANLQPLEAIRLLGEPLYKQLQYLSQIELRQEQQETVNSTRNFNLPPLTEFRGDIKGKVTFGFNKHRGIRLGFDLVGKKFEYGKFA